MIFIMSENINMSHCGDVTLWSIILRKLKLKSDVREKKNNLGLDKSCYWMPPKTKFIFEILKQQYLQMVFN